MTFSIAGRCVRTGMFGAAVCSSSPAVAARCVYAAAKTGAACSQNMTDPRLGPLLLSKTAEGKSAQQAIDEVVAASNDIAYRQISVVDAAGEAAAYSGPHCLGKVAESVESDCAAVGNLLMSEAIPAAMTGAFRSQPERHLGDRLVAALNAGRDSGGEAGSMHSAGLLIVDQVPWPVTDLRVDWDERPVHKLESLWRLWRPLAQDYLLRAIDPAHAPDYDRSDVTN